ncbi:TonB-dependent receptor [Pseudoalteromonas sp. T1lg24]|uniref:TonB-dependent receptor n=1 Tax=Pseudoalteromonas sp. T1lg24 TaxID=2077099 RepID=UPI000CF5FD65|nr:TonB-dependent receptor [Pseudoalteromonas sp. T1lg24]
MGRIPIKHQLGILLVIGQLLIGSWLCPVYGSENASFKLSQALIRIANRADYQLTMMPLVDEPNVVLPAHQLPLRQQLEKLLKNTQYSFAIYPELQSLVVFKRNADVENDKTWERVTITGHGANHRSILDSSVSISHLSQQQLNQHVPYSTAELFNLASGFWVEDSGGETNNNVAPRGLRGGEGYRFISLMEDGLPVVYDGIWPDFFLRQDLTTESVQIVKGGSSGIFTTNGPAAMVNFNTRKGGDTALFEAKWTQGLDYGYQRIDLFASGPLTKNMYYSTGGFYRTSNGLRAPGYTTDHGGQVKTRVDYLSAEFDLAVELKHLRDTTGFYAPIPMQNPSNPTGISPIDAGRSTLLSNELRFLSYPSENGFKTRDLADSQETSLNSLKLFFAKQLNPHIFIDNKLSISHLKNDFYTLVNQGNETLMSVQTLLAREDITAFMAQYPTARPALTYANSDEPVSLTQSLNGNGLMTFAYPLAANYSQTQWINHFSAQWLSERWQLQLGQLIAFSDYQSLPYDRWLGEILIDVKHRPQRYDVVALDSHNRVVDRLSHNGFLNFSGPAYIRGDGSLKSYSHYVNFDYDISDTLQLDIATRYEHLTLNGSVFSDVETIEPVTNLKHKTASEFAFSRSQTEKEWAYSAGVNWQFKHNNALFLRYASAFEMPRLLNLGNRIGYGDYYDDVPSDVDFAEPVDLTFCEIGWRGATDVASISASLFETRFDPLPFTVYQGLNDQHKAIFIDTKTQGLELEFLYEVNDHFSVAGVGVWQHGEFAGIPQSYNESQYNGNQITRTPKAQFRIMPTFTYKAFESTVTLAYIGKRYSDIANHFSLPAYTRLDVNLAFALSNQVKLSFSIENALNSKGLTEGNPRGSFSQTDEYYYARPIFGRHLNMSLHLTF